MPGSRAPFEQARGVLPDTPRLGPFPEAPAVVFVRLYLVQRALGHRQITTTEIYARVSDDTLRRAVTAA